MSEESSGEDNKEVATTEKRDGPKPGRKTNKLTNAEFMEASQKWRSGRYTLKELAEYYGITINGLWTRFQRNGVKRGEDYSEYEAKIRAAQLEEAAAAARERERDIRQKATETKDFLLKSVDAMSRRAVQSVIETTRAGNRVSDAMDDIRTLKEAILVFKNSVETIDKILPPVEFEDDELSTLVVENLTREDLEDIRREQEEAEELFGVNGDDSDPANINPQEVDVEELNP